MMLEIFVSFIKSTNEPIVVSVSGEEYENSEGRCDCLKEICGLSFVHSRMGENVNKKVCEEIFWKS